MLILQYTLIFTSVLAMVALGGMFAERSGVINLGLEGIMVIGALAGSIVSSALTKAGVPDVANVIISILSSMFAGWLFSMLLGVACITFKADQTLVGTALNIMSTALAVVIARMYTKTPSSEIAYQSSMFKTTTNIQVMDFVIMLGVLAVVIGVIALVSRILQTKYNKKLVNIKERKLFNRLPVNIYTICLAAGAIVLIPLVILIIIQIVKQPEGKALEISYFLPMMLLAVIASYVYLFKTVSGMRLMSCGEHPQAAGSVGINVYFQRYLGVSLSGILDGLGGFAYVIQSAGCWDFKYGVVGFGFLALAVMIFGQWKPVKIFLAALIFGLCQTASVFYAGKFGIPQFVYKMLPYVVCMIVLVLTSKKSKAPKAEGIPYDKGQR